MRRRARADERGEQGPESSLLMDDFLALMVERFGGKRYAETRRQFEELLALADVDGDGAISLDEFHAVMTIYGGANDAQVLPLYCSLTSFAGGDTIRATDLALYAEAGGLAVGAEHSGKAPSTIARTEYNLLLNEFEAKRSLTTAAIMQLTERVRAAIASKHGVADGAVIRA